MGRDGREIGERFLQLTDGRGRIVRGVVQFDDRPLALARGGHGHSHRLLGRGQKPIGVRRAFDGEAFPYPARQHTIAAYLQRGGNVDQQVGPRQ